MFKSKEIRWFFQTEDKPITKWFKKHELSFNTTSGRTDYYLPLPDKKDMGLKLREGKVEAKFRTSKPKLGPLTDYAEGYFENWVKWSFDVDSEDQLSKDIFESEKYVWIRIYKERMGIKLVKDEYHNLKFINIKEKIDFGCQVEYTRINVQGQQWFTFGFEWFGDEYLELYPKIATGIATEITTEILGDSTLKKEKSMGYAEFLNLNFREIPS